MSADSGIASVHDLMAGLWRQFDPQALATPEGFDASHAAVAIRAG